MNQNKPAFSLFHSSTSSRNALIDKKKKCNMVKRLIWKNVKELCRILIWLYIIRTSRFSVHLQCTLLERCLHIWGIILSACLFLFLCIGFGERGGLGLMAFQLFMHTSGWDASVENQMKVEWLVIAKCMVLIWVTACMCQCCHNPSAGRPTVNIRAHIC